jgi:hypothetical protein
MMGRQLEENDGRNYYPDRGKKFRESTSFSFSSYSLTKNVLRREIERKKKQSKEGKDKRAVRREPSIGPANMKLIK